jgi:hypothetical protein
MMHAIGLQLPSSFITSLSMLRAQNQQVILDRTMAMLKNILTKVSEMHLLKVKLLKMLRQRGKSWLLSCWHFHRCNMVQKHIYYSIAQWVYME